MFVRKSALISLLGTAFLASALAASPAQAQSPSQSPSWNQYVTADFRYNPDASVKSNYRTFRIIAKRACRSTGPGVASASAKRKACLADLMDRAVASTQRADMADLHFAETGRSIDSSRQLASTGE